MGKKKSDLDAESDNHPYDVEFFAKKHGLSLRAAGVVISANGPSRTACDAAAAAFLAAIAFRRQGPELHPSTTTLSSASAKASIDSAPPLDSGVANRGERPTHHPHRLSRYGR